MSIEQLLAPPNMDIGLSYSRLRSILKSFSGKSAFHARLAELLDENPEFLKRDMSQIDYDLIRRKLRCKTTKVQTALIDLYDTIADSELNSMEEIPRISETEFTDVINRFLNSSDGTLQSPKRYRKIVVNTILTDNDVMTGDTERINKTALCRTTKLKSKEVDLVLEELKNMFIEAERIGYGAESESSEDEAEEILIESQSLPQQTPLSREKPSSIYKPNANRGGIRVL